MNHRRRCMLLCAALLGMAARADASWHSSVRMTTGSDVDIDLTSPFTSPPPEGCMPVWATIKNHSGAAHTWTIRTTSGIMRGDNGNENVSTQTLRVENNATARLAVLLPLAPTLSATPFYQVTSVGVDGYGVEGGSVGLGGAGYSPKKPTATIGMGDALAVPLWEPLKKAFDDRGLELTGTPVDTTLLGADWRELSGLDCLWLTDTEYNRLDAPVRTAIRRWVERGGNFCLCAQTADPALRSAADLPETGNEARHGYGLVRLIPWNGKAFAEEDAIEVVNAVQTLRGDNPVNDATDWPMARALGAISINAPFLIGFIVVFAVLVGPFNLFWLADATRRHRLFWTTPLISLAASLLLMVVIVLQDGVGGHGQRVMVTLLCPDHREAVVLQEQVTRTGVLSSRGFTVAEDLLFTPLKLDRFFGKSFARSGRDFGGDWFASRSVQAQRAEAIVPSRAEVTLLNTDAAASGAPPVVVSSIPVTLSKFYYVDPAGHRWRGGNVRTGTPLTLQRNESEALILNFVGGSPLLGKMQTLATGPSGYFSAVADDAPFFNTLPSIRWQKQEAVYLGPITTTR